MQNLQTKKKAKYKKNNNLRKKHARATLKEINAEAYEI